MMISPIEGIRRVAVVTGSNQGIGYFIALQLALSGKFQDIVLACRSEVRAMDAIATMQQHQQLQASPSFSSSPATVLPNIQYENLILGNATSHQEFAAKMKENFGHVDCLVNNAAMAYKHADTTPHAEQCTPTLDVNYRGTVDFTECMLPLLRCGTDARIVNLSSSAARLGQVSPELQKKFTSPTLTMEELNALVDTYEKHVKEGTHQKHGWSNTNYGMSKLAITAATKVWARQEPTMKINCCDPGYCNTSMTSGRGTDPPEKGARTAVMLAIKDDLPSGEFFAAEKVAKW
mmetsp:Transcript_21313/g.60838  ORF Transcript_21313/g.60838 Transcript_21313/m.60838 type:complete len:291 (-) Transcript_21313:17-889(-)